MKALFKSGPLILALYFLSSACGSSPRGYESSNIGYRYNPDELALKANFKIVHLNDSVSRLHYRFHSKDLLYVRSGNKYEASFQLSYRLLPSLNQDVVIDSNSYLFEDEVSQLPDKVITGHFDFFTNRRNYRGKESLLVINFSDLKRNSNVRSFKSVEKKSLNNRQYFTLRDTSGQILFKPHLPPGVPFILEHKILEPLSYFVSVYKRDFPIALPPYSSRSSENFDIDPDTTFKVEAGEKLHLPHGGFFHFRLDTSQWEGFTIFSFYEEFPFIGSREHLGPPLRYLTTRSEYDGYLSVKGEPAAIKKWVDEFWLERSGSRERSRSLIKAYYERAEEANRLFSSYVEGWKSDRGIIYLVYGPPDKVHPTDNGEAWIYGNESSALPYTFYFRKMSNPFTANDYELERSSRYRYGWGQAIEAWRNGHIYNSKDIRREQNAQDQIQYRNRSPVWY